MLGRGGVAAPVTTERPEPAGRGRTVSTGASTDADCRLPLRTLPLLQVVRLLRKSPFTTLSRAQTPVRRGEGRYGGMLPSLAATRCNLQDCWPDDVRRWRRSIFEYPFD